MTDQEINQMIDEIQNQSEEFSAEARNALHACRPNHPLGIGRERSTLFSNAHWMLVGRFGVSGNHLDWLKRMSKNCE